MESKPQPSEVVLQELVDSLRALGKSSKATDVTIICVEEDEVEYEFEAHTAVICPRSKMFTDLLQGDIESEPKSVHYCWTFRKWSRVVVGNVLQYMYDLEYQVDSADEKVPNISIHADMWCAGENLGIKGLKFTAAHKFGLALSDFNTYGTEVGFTFAFFEDFVEGVQAVWENVPRSCRTLRSQVSLHIQENIKKWADKEGAEARFIESSYRLIFREIQEQTVDPEPVLDVIRAKYKEHLDAETGHAALAKSCGAQTFDNAETEDAASVKDSGALTFDNAVAEDAASEKDGEVWTFDDAVAEDAVSEKDSKFDEASADLWD